jgi:DNA-binding NtrC family response regulator
MDTARLLIVDDDMIVRTLAAEALKATGFEVSEASNVPMRMTARIIRDREAGE